VIETVGEVDAGVEAPELTAAGMIVIPGLVNAHTHSGENLNPGLYENLPLDLWFLHSHQVTRTAPPDRDVIYVRTLVGAVLVARCGTTTAVDFLYEAPEITATTLEAVVAAYRDVGLRATSSSASPTGRFSPRFRSTPHHAKQQGWRLRRRGASGSWSSRRRQSSAGTSQGG